MEEGGGGKEEKEEEGGLGVVCYYIDATLDHF